MKNNLLIMTIYTYIINITIRSIQYMPPFIPNDLQ
jgi:hypothetical protein